jgi:CubicO group peptidase (beta-lactamase class C family)
MVRSMFSVLLSLSLLAAAARPPDHVRDVGKYINGLAAAGRFSGNVLIAREGKVIFERSYGDASAEFRIPNTSSTRFRIFSTTKQIIATAVLQLAAQHHLALDESITTILPELPKAWATATVSELLQHTSGVPADEPIWGAQFEQSEVQTQLANLVAIAPKIADQTLLSPPGTKWAYNNFGYDLLGCIIERVSGMPLGAYLQSHIFRAAGMHTAFLQGRAGVSHTMYSGNAVEPQVASGYNGEPGLLETADPQMYASAGAGGIVATARDLLAYDNALSSGALLPAKWAQRAISDAYHTSPRASYGFGWIVVRTAGGQTYAHHSGGSNGYTSDYVRIPSEQICIVILSNFGFASAEDAMRNEILRIMLGPTYEPLALPSPPASG